MPNLGTWARISTSRPPKGRVPPSKRIDKLMSFHTVFRLTQIITVSGLIDFMLLRVQQDRCDIGHLSM